MDNDLDADCEGVVSLVEVEISDWPSTNSVDDSDGDQIHEPVLV